MASKKKKRKEKWWLQINIVDKERREEVEGKGVLS